ncbi:MULTISPECIES: ABC transporter ATP-binding protein [unclassified Brevibacterium]|uniref:ABC transporter ATP-binding protein n=1 Tax=unclassified Brevibacterium TaxID=2614124 RepID=UPI0010921063|nr:ABC transporter ATP-binding protein [Brevibacterium sp. S22]TGD28031.1 ABC transporter ATP-binding protein [Brevibacterium sp. S22]
MTRVRLAARLIEAAGNLYPSLIASTICRILNQLLGIALLVIAAMAIVGVARGGEPRLGALIIALVVIALVKAGLRYLEHYLGHRVAFTALQRLRELFFARLVPQAPAATTGRAGAELTERASGDIDRIEVFFAHTFPPAVSAVVVPAIALTWLGLAVDGTLALTLAVIVVLMLSAPVLTSRSTWRASADAADARGDLAGHIGDDVHGIREVLTFGAQDRRLHKLDADGRALSASRSSVARIQAGRSALLVALQLIGLVAVVVVGTAGGGASDAALATATALAVFAGLWVPVRGIENFSTGLDTALAAAARVWEIIDAAPAVPDNGTAHSPTGPTDITVDSVSLHYPGRETPALAEVVARFRAGTWSAVVGVSGSGKSTLASLLVRGREPESGGVRLGEVDATDLPLDVLRRRIAFVTQHPTLLSGSLAENLRLAAPEASDDLIDEALSIVALDDWAAGLPEGLATRMQGRGLTVSGGQLQRLAIARALVGEPEVLVLDEALSQLDAATASTVRHRLAESRPELTVIEITHRADLLPDDTEVVVMDSGRLVEHGPAGDLRRADGPFTRVEARNAPGR